MNDRTSTRLKLAAMLAVAGVHMPTLPAQPSTAAPAPPRRAPRQELEIKRVMMLPLPETRQQRRKRERDLAKRARK